MLIKVPLMPCDWNWKRPIRSKCNNNIVIQRGKSSHSSCIASKELISSLLHSQYLNLETGEAECFKKNY